MNNASSQVKSLGSALPVCSVPGHGRCSLIQIHSNFLLLSLNPPVRVWPECRWGRRLVEPGLVVNNPPLIWSLFELCSWLENGGIEKFSPMEVCKGFLERNCIRFAVLYVDSWWQAEKGRINHSEEVWQRGTAVQPPWRRAIIHKLAWAQVLIQAGVTLGSNPSSILFFAFEATSPGCWWGACSKGGGRRKRAAIMRHLAVGGRSRDGISTLQTHAAEVKITDAAASAIQLFSRFSEARGREKQRDSICFFFCLSFIFLRLPALFFFFFTEINLPKIIEQERQVIKQIRSAFSPTKKLLRQEIICDAIAIVGNTTPAGGRRF